MSTLLINGCSYTTNWTPLDQKLGYKLGHKEVVNLSIPGSSNDSIIRRTINYILEHKVDMAFVSLTFWERQEAPWAVQGTWTDYHPNGILRPDEVIDEKIYQQYINSRFKYDLDNRYVEKLLDDVILLSGWLTSSGIKHLIFSSPHSFKLSVTEYNLLKNKLEYIRSNASIIDLEHWSANQYMHDQGGKWHEFDSNVAPDIRHYTSKSYTILNKFIIDYLNYD